jgi:hypothetical protein
MRFAPRHLFPQMAKPVRNARKLPNQFRRPNILRQGCKPLSGDAKQGFLECPRTPVGLACISLPRLPRARAAPPPRRLSRIQPISFEAIPLRADTSGELAITRSQQSRRGT